MTLEWFKAAAARERAQIAARQQTARRTTKEITQLAQFAESELNKAAQSSNPAIVRHHKTQARFAVGEMEIKHDSNSK